MRNSAFMRDLGLLILRVSMGLMLAFGHGWGKLVSFGADMHQFPDPIGIGSPLSMALCVFAEFFCGLAVAAGLFTRAASVPVIINMGVAMFVVHRHDPWSKAELAALYFFPYLMLAMVGGGRFAMDSVLEKLRLKRVSS
ncbi:MAG TPA: DoxX family protein [Bdellovibrionota bacterium]|nr:DoxX family protein [Bdellovibrionota bacterium]